MPRQTYRDPGEGYAARDEATPPEDAVLRSGQRRIRVRPGQEGARAGLSSTGMEARGELSIVVTLQGLS